VIDSRLSLALSGGGLVLPDTGVIAAIKPKVERKADFLPGRSVEVIEGFAPEVQAWESFGMEPVQEPADQYAAVILSLPRAKAEAHAMIARAMQISEGPVVIDGQKTDGVDSILREIRKRVRVEGPINKSHGKLFWCPVPDAEAFADWRAGPERTSGGFWTAPGIFSADGVDPGSELLAEWLPKDLGRQVADLGAGWGYLSAHVLTRETVEAVHLVEADWMALECARRNVTDPRAQFHWADATGWRPLQKMDSVVVNPPFHVGRQTDASLGAAFIVSAAAVLARSGHLWMVANRHLPYEGVLKASFGDVQVVGDDPRYKIFHARKPLAGGARAA
jgi:16S rRNA (guanine1207-N2)-methyltransferase